MSYFKKSKHLESNVLEHHSVKTKISGGHPVENILANDFRGSLSKLNH